MNISAIELSIANRKEKIAKIQKEISDLVRQKEAAENAQIISVIRKANVSLTDIMDALPLITTEKEKTTDKKEKTNNV